MSEQKAAAGAGGTVRLGDRAVYVAPLAIREEAALLDDLRRLAKEQQGDFLRPVEGLLDRLEKMKTPQAAARAALILETVARMEARRELPGDDAAHEARRTPRGVALELWYRGRKAHPTLSLAELEAVVTEANAAAVHAAILDALGAGDDSKSG